MPKPTTVDEFIGSLPAHARPVMEQLRRIIRKAVPKGKECISYGIGAIEVDGRKAIYFSGYAGHVGVYPVPSSDPALSKAIAPYRAGKGTLRFALDEKLPAALITRVARQLAKDAAARAAKAAAKKSTKKRAKA